MRRLKKILIVFTLILFLPQGGRARVYLDIDSPTFRPFFLAIPDFVPLDPGRKEKEAGLSLQLANLLNMTGFFSVIDRKAYLEEPPGERVIFPDWQAVGAEFLIKGYYDDRGGVWKLLLRLYDVVKGENLLEKTYTGAPRESILFLRRFAGDVLQVLTGEGRIFQTRIAFTVKKKQGMEILSLNFDGTEPIIEKETKSILMSPRWSPDGRYLSYTSFEEGNPDFYIKDRQTGKTMRVSTFRGINLSGGWSPTGDKVLLTLSKDGNEEIYLLDFGNKLLRRLTNDYAIDVSPTWSPDGRKIAFVSDRAGSPQIYLMDTDGSNVRRLTFEGNYNTSPAWSPKGDRIAFEGRVQGVFQIFTIGENGENLRQLTFEREGCYSPVWSPDGRFLAISKREGGRGKIYIMNASGGNKRLLYGGEGDASSPAWSPFLP